MAMVRAAFRGLNTDLPPTRTPSGTADVALNVTVRNGKLQKRAGFAEYEDDVDGSATGIRNLFVARFADGDVYVVARIASATISYQLYHRKTDATSFTRIPTAATHNTADRGWGFTWGDRFHYFDRAGGTRWDPDVATAYKAGLTRATTGAAVATAAGGEKDGQYHLGWTLYNNATHEEGAMSTPNTPTLECRLGQTPDISAVTVSNWSTIRALFSDYEWTHARFWSSIGNTEYIATSASAGVECFSYRMYADALVIKSQSAAAALNKADHVHDQNEMLTNTGGEPPGAQIGCFTGMRGIYGRVWQSSALVPDKIMFSIPYFPTMVPQLVSYSVGGDAKAFEPKPWRGEIRGGMAGSASAMAYGGGIAAVFTPASTWSLQTRDDGRLYPVLVRDGIGCVTAAACCGASDGVHALGYRTWLRLSTKGAVNLAEDSFTTTLAEIPVAQQSDAVMAYRGYTNEVWCAVTKTGATVAQRILVYSLNTGDLVIFEPAGMGTTESITAMCELAYEGAEPTMLVGTSTGRILQYPSGTQDVASGGTATDFPAQWRGYFGQERAGYDQMLDLVTIHCGDDVSDNVTLGWRAMRTGGETVTQRTRTLSKSNKAEPVKMDLEPPHGHLYQLEFSSDATVSDQWTINDLTWRIGRTDN